MSISRPDSFFNRLPVFADFEGVTREENYTPLPQDWWLAAADIVDSTVAIASGHYKAVNMAGASVISAVLNALGQHDLPFIFGGDGAIIAVPADGADAARDALAKSRRWVGENMNLALRVALVPVADIRSAGLDVRIGRFKASEQVNYAMFSGGGANWAERRMKDGFYGIEDDQSAGAPDLSGLSCRWNPVKSRNGSILSIIALPRPGADPDAFRRLVSDVVAMAGNQERQGHPLPAEGPPIKLSMKGCRSEILGAPPGLSRVKTAFSVFTQTALIFLLSKLGLKAGSFDPKVYREDVSANSDFRKYDDGLKMTVDIDEAKVDMITRRLQEAETAGICLFGLHVQDSALVTCLVPTPLSRDHMHFVDGGSGGYAMAASRIKKNLTP